jgi:hypothetical protein
MIRHFSIGSLAILRAAMMLLPLAVGCSTSSGSAPAPAPAACPGALGTPEEIAATPRSDAEAEFLALALGDRVTADPATYARASVELARIRAMAPDIAELRVRGRDGERIQLVVEDGTPIDAQTYHEWDCLNAHYGLVAVQGSEQSPFATFPSVKLKGRYATDLVACAYARLPHIANAEAAGYWDSANIFAFAEGDVFHYVFDAATGDCFVGCATHVASHFVSDENGTITRLPTYSSTSGEDEPDWFRRTRPKARACPH